MSIERPKLEAPQSQENNEEILKAQSFFSPEAHKDNFATNYSQAIEIMKNEGLPVSANGRINAEAFKGTVYDDARYNIYLSQLEGTRARRSGREVDVRRIDFRNSARPKTAKELEAEHEEKAGGKLERLATFVFSANKLFNEYFMYARSTFFDDEKNGADNLIIDRATGEVIGIADEVVDATNGTLFTSKVQDIEDKYRKNGGALVRFGVGLDEANKVIPVGHVGNLPAIIINLPQAELERKLADINSKDSNKFEEVKQALYKLFFGQLETQIGELKKRISTLHPDLANKVNLLDSRLQEIKSKI